MEQFAKLPVLSAGSGSEEYRAPEWLHTARGVYFDGYSPPVYPNIKDFDARKLLEIVVKLGGNLLRFQPIGYWAYYPSKSFRVFPGLDGRDLINEVMQECRRADIHCYCYIGYGHPHMEVGWVDKHPEYADWVLRDPQGKPYGVYVHNGDPVQRLCLTGDAYRRGIRQVVKELCAHDIDGVYFDAPSGFGYSGICFCETCRRNYRAFSGMDLGRLASLVKLNGLSFDVGSNLPPDTDMEALIAWFAWATYLVREDFLYFRELLHDSNKFMLCHNGDTWSGASLPLQYRIPDGFMVEASDDIPGRLMTGLMGSSMARPYNKTAQMYLGGYNVTSYGEPPHENPSIVHNTNLEDGDEIQMQGYTDLACGNIPLYATANRMFFNIGSGSSRHVQEVFAFMKRTEPLLKGSIPAPYMTIVPTWESLQRWRERKDSWNWPMMSSAMGLAMLDKRIAFDVNPSTEMSEEWLRSQKVIALCGASGISDDDAARLTAWVSRGGGLLVTYDSGLYDAKGRQRQDGGALKEVLGVEIQGGPLTSLPESFYRVVETSPVLGSYEKGAILQADGTLVPVATRGDARTVAECWDLRTGIVRGPGIVVHNYGKGRTVYVSGSIEANYRYDRVPSNLSMLNSMVEFLGQGELQPFKMEAPRGIYGVLRKTAQGDLTLWLLANVGFKDAAIGLMRQEYLPVADVKVSILVPEGRKLRDIQLLRAERSLSWQMEGRYAVATIPSLHIAEVVYVQLA
ncbi:MAG TPA: beta-galactosidase trimerization domain-containing protein [Terracidiphilus sp.]|nr:beta-galactosidase trimerization domain-containing protein [Terracidiphilus sp.]